jgi:hypothetical protein
VQNRLGFWCIRDFHNTIISSVSAPVNTSYKGVYETLMILDKLTNQ